MCVEFGCLSLSVSTRNLHPVPWGYLSRRQVSLDRRDRTILAVRTLIELERNFGRRALLLWTVSVSSVRRRGMLRLTLLLLWLLGILLLPTPLLLLRNVHGPSAVWKRTVAPVITLGCCLREELAEIRRGTLSERELGAALGIRAPHLVVLVLSVLCGSVSKPSSVRSALLAFRVCEHLVQFDKLFPRVLVRRGREPKHQTPNRTLHLVCRLDRCRRLLLRRSLLLWRLTLRGGLLRLLRPSLLLWLLKLTLLRITRHTP